MQIKSPVIYILDDKKKNCFWDILEKQMFSMNITKTSSDTVRRENQLANGWPRTA